ncbi:unnamed protein product [Closterium sp. Naga37s-1]|nr:unnamed protein product [Closterium sp. Naga37s-1]
MGQFLAHKTHRCLSVLSLLLLAAILASGTDLDPRDPTNTAAASQPPEVTGKQEKDVTQLQIGVKFKPKKCGATAHLNDRVKVHYRGFLTDGRQFDNTHDLDKPVEFRIGAGSVIKGWENGVLGMCLGEKRKLKIPPHLGYGDEGHVYGIPPGATIIFDVQLVGLEIARKKRSRATA